MSDVLGTLGVGLLLVAFGLGRLGRIGRRPYALLNAAGSGLAGAASVIIGFIPFVALEAAWCLVAVADLTVVLANKRPTAVS